MKGLWQIVAWHLGLAAVVAVSWGCVGMLGAILLDDQVSKPGELVLVEIDVSGAETSVQVSSGEALPESFEAEVNGTRLARHGGRLTGRVARRRAYRVTLAPGFLGYDTVAHPPKAARRLRLHGNTAVLETVERDLAQRYDLSVRGAQVPGGPEPSPEGIIFTLSERPVPPTRICVEAHGKRDLRALGQEARLDAGVTVSFTLACADAEPH